MGTIPCAAWATCGGGRVRRNSGRPLVAELVAAVDREQACQAAAQGRWSSGETGTRGIHLREPGASVW